ncbi:hypothetical protein CEXT_282441 [Caerostris extrusa]|uniref:Uncharacterized protein n=1 Tax=Caerostris extrusa TaxID=172846 RepID=A0AAV4MHR5_CAEEX|nr:hypothetical protein CEXT_282441 [Caerostris extrusa]
MMQQSINVTELQQDCCNRMDLESCRDLRVEKLRDIIRKLKRSLKSFEDEEKSKKQRVMRGLVLRIKKNKFSKFKKKTKNWYIVKDILRSMSEDEKGVKAMEKLKKKKTTKSIGTQTEMASSSNDNEDCIPATDAGQLQQQSEVKDSAAKDASERSYICESIAERAGLKTAGKEKLKIFTFTSNEASVSELKRKRITLKTATVT